MNKLEKPLSRVLEKVQIQETLTFGYTFMAEDFIQTCNDVALGEAAAVGEEGDFFISLNSFLKIVLNFTFVVLSQSEKLFC